MYTYCYSIHVFSTAKSIADTSMVQTNQILAREDIKTKMLKEKYLVI